MDAQNGLGPAGERTEPAIPAAERERMEVELELARRAALPVALLAISSATPSMAHAPPDLAARALRAVEERLKAAVGLEGATVLRSDNVLYALLPRRDLDAARSLAERLVAEAKHARIEGVERELRISLSIGLARDESGRGLWLQALLGVAVEGLELARSRGGECAVHTELYALCQRRAERSGERPQVVIPPELEARALAAKPAAPPPKPASPRALRPPAAPDGHSQTEVSSAPSSAPDVFFAAPPEESDALREALASRERAHREEVELLERRIAKLIGTLEGTERELRDAMRRQGAATGVPSIYREVQGLSAEDEHYQVKAALMERILQANLELRECLRLQRESQR